MVLFFFAFGESLSLDGGMVWNEMMDDLGRGVAIRLQKLGLINCMERKRSEYRWSTNKLLMDANPIQLGHIL